MSQQPTTTKTNPSKIHCILLDQTWSLFPTSIRHLLLDHIWATHMLDFAAFAGSVHSFECTHILFLGHTSPSLACLVWGSRLGLLFACCISGVTILHEETRPRLSFTFHFCGMVVSSVQALVKNGKHEL